MLKLVTFNPSILPSTVSFPQVLCERHSNAPPTVTLPEYVPHNPLLLTLCMSLTHFRIPG